jgi:hypothetical protein
LFTQGYLCAEGVRGMTRCRLVGWFCYRTSDRVHVRAGGKVNSQKRSRDGAILCWRWRSWDKQPWARSRQNGSQREPCLRQSSGSKWVKDLIILAMFDSSVSALQFKLLDLLFYTAWSVISNMAWLWRKHDHWHPRALFNLSKNSPWLKYVTSSIKSPYVFC